MQNQVNRNAESSVAPQFIIQGGVINIAELVKPNAGTRELNELYTNETVEFISV